jgi:hypothetical protein
MGRKDYVPMHRIPPSQRMEQAFFQSIFEGKNILSGMVQAGAQLMLQPQLCQFQPIIYLPAP